jgi:hypothetical protein
MIFTVVSDVGDDFLCMNRGFGPLGKKRKTAYFHLSPLALQTFGGSGIPSRVACPPHSPLQLYPVSIFII